MRITRVYTKVGDGGLTRLGGGQELAKDALRIEVVGTVDELNSTIGVALAEDLLEALRTILVRIQNELFDLGSDLCFLEADKQRWPIRGLEERHVDRLEADLDRLQADLGPLEEFVLPGGTKAAAALHLARAVCRRAERLTVRLGREESIGARVLPYLNRLSDLLFVMARYENRARGRSDVLWDRARDGDRSRDPDSH